MSLFTDKQAYYYIDDNYNKYMFIVCNIQSVIALHLNARHGSLGQAKVVRYRVINITGFWFAPFYWLVHFTQRANMCDDPLPKLLGTLCFSHIVRLPR